MNSHRLKPRLGLTKTEGNILMTQIRAEKKLYLPTTQHPFTYRDDITTRTGKKVYKDLLYKATLSPSKQTDSFNTNRSDKFGKRMNIEPILFNERSVSGKKRFPLNSNVESSSPMFKRTQLVAEGSV